MQDDYINTDVILMGDKVEEEDGNDDSGDTGGIVAVDLKGVNKGYVEVREDVDDNNEAEDIDEATERTGDVIVVLKGVDLVDGESVERTSKPAESKQISKNSALSDDTSNNTVAESIIVVVIL